MTPRLALIVAALALTGFAASYAAARGTDDDAESSPGLEVLDVGGGVERIPVVDEADRVPPLQDDPSPPEPDGGAPPTEAPASSPTPAPVVPEPQPSAGGGSGGGDADTGGGGSNCKRVAPVAYQAQAQAPC